MTAPRPLNATVWFAIGAAGAIVGLLPWLVTGARLPLQNLGAGSAGDMGGDGRPQPESSAAGPAQTEKYFASGWWKTNASVDCSGCSCSSSLSSTPIRSGRSSRATLRRSSMAGHAG